MRTSYRIAVVGMLIHYMYVQVLRAYGYGRSTADGYYTAGKFRMYLLAKKSQHPLKVMQQLEAGMFQL